MNFSHLNEIAYQITFPFMNHFVVQVVNDYGDKESVFDNTNYHYAVDNMRYFWNWFRDKVQEEIFIDLEINNHPKRHEFFDIGWRNGTDFGGLEEVYSTVKMLAQSAL